jgi:Integrase core domain
MSTDDGGIDHHVFVVGIAAQQLENTLENPAFHPSVFRRAILTPRIASSGMLLDKFPPMTGAASPNRVGVADGGKNQHGRAARGGVGGDGALPVGQAGGEGAHSRRAVRDDGLASQACGARTSATRDCRAGEVAASRERRRRYGATTKDALTALWEASDRVCGKRLKVMIPTLLPALEQHGRLKLDKVDRDRVLAISAATIDRLLGDVKVAASGGKRRRAGFYSAIRREVPIRTFNDWKSPPPGFCEVDMVAHGGTSVAGSFIQTLTMVDVATGWTECLPLVTRDGSLVVEAMKRLQSLFPWLLRGVDFDNDSAFMNDVVVPWCREQKLEVTRSRAYKKNDQAFVEQKNGAVVRRDGNRSTHCRRSAD